MLTLPQLKSEVDRLAEKIGASGYTLPTYGRTEDGARPHIESDSRGYHYVVVERGQELSRFTTVELDNLLYRVFADVTFDLACEYELAHRIESQDSRRLMFQRQIDLLRTLSHEWVERQSQEHDRILRANPYDDCSGVRVCLATELGWAKACEAYPLPNPNDGGSGSNA
jgi:hypothetical protein